MASLVTSKSTIRPRVSLLAPVALARSLVACRSTRRFALVLAALTPEPVLTSFASSIRPTQSIFTVQRASIAMTQISLRVHRREISLLAILWQSNFFRARDSSACVWRARLVAFRTPKSDLAIPEALTVRLGAHTTGTPLWTFSVTLIAPPLIPSALYALSSPAVAVGIFGTIHKLTVGWARSCARAPIQIPLACLCALASIQQFSVVQSLLHHALGACFWTIILTLLTVEPFFAPVAHSDSITDSLGALIAVGRTRRFASQPTPAGFACFTLSKSVQTSIATTSKPENPALVSDVLLTILGTQVCLPVLT
mmetsp:Transcript_21474/g.52187  ORF Transcript_21474/g.52187 Transcript_21474/m.52187 type:complete len:311 (-) Transcript_21474:340-1272(-)